jgi:peptidoglycan/LPS O-acetylase OafA/YrhL
MGYIRFALAILIMRAHLGPVVPGYAAATAVVLFYALAGYTATSSMQVRYAGQPWRFLWSRFLRLWPTYAVVFMLSLSWLLISGEEWGSMAVPIGVDMPLQWLGIVRNGGINAAVPVAWFLQYLALGYALIAVGFAATPQRCALWLVGSLLWSQWLSFQLDFRDYYSTVAMMSLAFSAGASAFHLGLALPRDGRWGQWAGALSYPIFLCHYGVGAILPVAYGWPLFFAALPPTLALSWALVVFVERPVSRFRIDMVPPTP